MQQSPDLNALSNDAAAIVSAIGAQSKILEPNARELTRYEVDLATVTLTAGNPRMLIAGGIHLPEESDIRSAYVENNGATAAVLVYIGSSGVGRLVDTVFAGGSTVIPFPDGIKSLSIIASGSANDAGVVTVAITTDVWDPYDSDNLAVSLRIGTAGGPLVSNANPLPVDLIAPGTQVENSATAGAALANSVALAAAAGKTTWITGFELTAGPVVAAVFGAVTITGPTVALNYVFTETVAAGGSLVVEFPQPIPASAVNTAITVALAAITGGSATALNVHGFQQ